MLRALCLMLCFVLSIVSSHACGLAMVDIVFILDASTSVGPYNYEMMKSFCKDFLKNADLDSGNVRVGLISYSTEVHIEFTLNRYGDFMGIFSAIDILSARLGVTNTADALKTMRTQMYTAAYGDRSGVPNIVIILSDGESTINSHRTILEAELARNQGIQIYAVGIGLRDTGELDAVATPPASENTFYIEDFDELSTLPDKVFRSLCQRIGLYH